ncbi:DUF1398 domain-containing protein [Dyella sp. M7H15-1]|uniref:DUF1398 domain-containing protein n=1 Tax=Dyella sp. M7H15-1 TaxID=2501295 RepID=UPI00100517F5|nr:DUF1398 family protein [Dyella sp. M7H15-1]QAU24030.1 DUF1398 domain-containing protein [Dyella sp. M7H15-1]
MNIRSIVEECTRSSEDDSINFPDQLKKLAAAGVEGYYADLRNSKRTYYLSDGETIEVSTAKVGVPVTTTFNAKTVGEAIRLSQSGAHTYREFCEKVMKAGCASYLVSLLGRKVVYLARSGESHVEYFPSGK